VFGDFLAQLCAVLALQTSRIHQAAAAGEALPRPLLERTLDVLDSPLQPSDAALLAASGAFRVLPRLIAALSAAPAEGVGSSSKHDTCSYAFTGAKTVFQDGFECVTCDLVKVRTADVLACLRFAPLALAPGGRRRHA
jgi:hypothetical protein